MVQTFPHYKNAPSRVQSEIRLALSQGEYMGHASPAQGICDAIDVATRHGYAWPVEDVPTPATDQLARLRQEDPVAAGELTISASIELQFEALAVEKAGHQPRTLAGIARERERERAEQVERNRAERVEARTQEIMREQDARAFEKARARAEKEIAQ